MTGSQKAAVWLLAVGQLLTYAGVYYAYAALLPDLEAATGWSKAELAAGPTLAFLIMACLTPFTGRIVDRGFGGEMLIYLPVPAALALAAVGQVHSHMAWLILWAIIGAAQAGCLYETCFAFLTRRMGDAARMAITRVTLIAGLAGTLAFPLGDWLGRNYGADGALLVFALLILIGAVPANLIGVRILRLGERAGGLVTPKAAPGAVAAAMRLPAFWAIALMFGLIWLNHGILLTYVLELFADRGASHQMATIAAACIGPSQVLGRLILMMNEERVGNERATRIAIGSVLAAALLLWLAGVAPILIFLVAFAQGAGVGMLSILRPVLIADHLGRGGFGAISGVIAVAPILATAFAPTVGAWLLIWGGPWLVYGLSMAMAVTAGLVWLRLSRRAA